MDSRPRALSQRDIVPTWHSLVDHRTIVPECDRTWCPFPAHTQVVCLEEMFTEKRQNMVRLLPIQFLNAVNEAWIVIEDFESGDWMRTDLGQ